MEHIVFSDDSIVEEVTNYISDTINTLMTNNTSKILIGLSGGNSPKALYTQMARTISAEVAQRLVFIQIDERMVDSNHEDSNQRLIRSTLTPLFEKGAAFYPMPVVFEQSNHTRACEEYETTINNLLDNSTLPTVLSGIALLGVGTDGHTASIFPDQIADIPKDDRLVFMTPREKNGYFRMSMSFKAIYDMAHALVYVPGIAKKDIINLLLDESHREEYPAAQVLYTHVSGTLFSSK